MIYDFDTTATSPVIPEVLSSYARRLGEPAINPASSHAGGLRAAQSIALARQSIAASLDCLPEEVFFTSGGTESINHAIKGFAWSNHNKPARAVTTAGEHEAVLESMAFIKEQLGYEISYARLLPSGSVDSESLFAFLQDRSCDLVSIIAVNNETGAINDLEALVPQIRRLVPHVVIHSDIVQKCGKLAFSFRRSGIDLASIAGHKFGAPKSTGLLLKRKDLHLTPLLHGGGQQAGMRSGTENVPGALALMEAIEYHEARMDEDLDRVRTLRSVFVSGIRESGIPHHIVSSDDGSPYVLSIAFPGIRGETLMNALSAESIYVSTGSACGSKRAGDNRVLEAMGIDRQTIMSAVRISFSPHHSDQDIRHLVERINDLFIHYATR